MTTSMHITNLIPDYLLGLLSPHESQQVETHVHSCSICRSALAEERQIGQAVRETLAIITRPAPAQLARLRPAVPRKARFRPVAFFQSGQRLAAAAMLILLIIAGAWSLYPGIPGPDFTDPQAVTSIAVTATREPTSTSIPATPADILPGTGPDSGPSPTYQAELNPLETPLPAGTPVAALLMNSLH